MEAKLVNPHFPNRLEVKILKSLEIYALVAGPLLRLATMEKFLFHGAMELHRNAMKLPHRGMPRETKVALQEHVHNRLKSEGANTHFQNRLSTEFARFLSRAFLLDSLL